MKIAADWIGDGSTQFTRRRPCSTSSIVIDPGGKRDWLVFEVARSYAYLSRFPARVEIAAADLQGQSQAQESSRQGAERDPVPGMDPSNT